MKTIVLTAILCATLYNAVPLMSSPQAPAPTPADLNAAAVKAYQAKDYATFLADENRALDLAPGTPRLLYNVACGEALQGNAAASVHRLDQLLAQKLDLGADTDTDFAAIRKTPEWAGYETRLAELRKPIIHSAVAFTLPDPGIVATGIAVDPATGDTYIASVRERKIVRRAPAGQISDFISQAQDGFMAGASLALDSQRRLLYASTAAAPFMLGYRKEDAGQSGIFAFDLKSGKLARKVLLPADGKQHFLNALAIAGDGAVYVSDSATAGIYRLRPGADVLEPFIAPNLFKATQGLAFSPDDKTLYVVDFTDGLWALDLATKERRHLDTPAGVWLGGLDGLSRVNDDFISVQIGAQPARVLRLRLDASGRRIAHADILEMGRPDYAGPIQGVVTDNAFLYIANSQLNLANGETGAFAADRAVPTVVLRLPL